MEKNKIELGTPISQERIQIDGKVELKNVYRIDINSLYYNDENGRISTFIAEYNATHEETIDRLPFEQYNNVLMNYVKKSGSKDKFQITKNDIAKNGQLKVGIVLDDGRIIDGNRRFTCLRELYSETNKEEYKYFECFVLPTPTTNQEKTMIKTLELKYQFGEDQREEYNPIDRLVHVYNCLVKKPVMFSPEEYRDRVNNQLKIADIKMAMTKAEIMEEYLEFINKPKRYDIARDEKLDGPIQEIATLKKKIKDKYEWNQASTVLYTFLKNKTSGDRTREIRELTKLYTNNKSKFDEIKEQAFALEMKKSEINEQQKITDYVSEKQIFEVKEKEQKLTSNFNKAVAQTKLNQAKQKQFDIVKAANKKMNDIDIVEIQYLSQEIKTNMKKELNDLKKLIEKIEEKLNA